MNMKTLVCVHAPYPSYNIRNMCVDLLHLRDCHVCTCVVTCRQKNRFLDKVNLIILKITLKMIRDHPCTPYRTGKLFDLVYLTGGNVK